MKSNHKSYYMKDTIFQLDSYKLERIILKISIFIINNKTALKHESETLEPFKICCTSKLLSKYKTHVCKHNFLIVKLNGPLII